VSGARGESIAKGESGESSEWVEAGGEGSPLESMLSFSDFGRRLD